MDLQQKFNNETGMCSTLNTLEYVEWLEVKVEQRQETASAVDTIVMQKPFIRRYFELLKLTEEDCSCGRIARCDSCCAASVLNEVEELIKTEHGRLFA